MPPTESTVLLSTGEGKEKSAAATGVMSRGWTRGWERGWRVGEVQSVQGAKGKTGEHKLADHLDIEWHTLGDGFTGESTDLDEAVAKGRYTWEVAREKPASGDCDLLILDGRTSAVSYGWITVGNVVEGVSDRHRGTNVVVNGRNAAPALIELDDTATEMRKLRHANDRGVKTTKGIDY